MCQEFDPANPNEELLKEMVIAKINAKRLKRKASPISLNASLQKTADNYVSAFRHNKFENNAENKLKIKRKVKKNTKANGYKNAFVDFHILSLNAMNFYGKNFYYDKEDSETSTHLFTGDKPSKKEKEKQNYKPHPMKHLTYEELANIIAKTFVRDDGYFGSLNNGYDKYGFSLAIDQRTIFRNKIPKIKVILIVGGNRITW